MQFFISIIFPMTILALDRYTVVNANSFAIRMYDFLVLDLFEIQCKVRCCVDYSALLF